MKNFEDINANKNLLKNSPPVGRDGHEGWVKEIKIEHVRNGWRVSLPADAPAELIAEAKARGILIPYKL